MEAGHIRKKIMKKFVSFLKFPNEKSSLFHVATTPNTFLRIEPDGRVKIFFNEFLFLQIFTSQRMTVKAMCPMNLAMFPMDSQTCKLGLESYGYDVDDIGRKTQNLFISNF